MNAERHVFKMSHAEVLSEPTAFIAAERIAMRRNVRAHAHDFAELVIVIDGEGEHFTEAGALELRPGMLLLLGPDSWHSYGTSAKLDVINLYLSDAALRLTRASATQVLSSDEALRPLTTAGAVTARILTPEDAAHVARFLDGLAKRPTTRYLRQLSLLFALLDEVAVASERAPTMSTTPFTHEHASLGEGMLRHNLRVSHAVSLLHDRLEEAWTLPMLASLQNISPSQLTRAFRDELKVGPMTYLRQLRAERMAYLLRTTDLAIGATARAVGWNDPGYASRRFSAHWGISPAAYRKRIPTDALAHYDSSPSNVHA